MAYLDTLNTAYFEMDTASAGTANALYELGLIYATGRDGEQDMVAAHKWFNIAAFRGMEEARLRREEIARDMTRSEIRIAQREAREWITQH
jgi:hypothetical protein